MHQFRPYVLHLLHHGGDEDSCRSPAVGTDDGSMRMNEDPASCEWWELWHTVLFRAVPVISVSYLRHGLWVSFRRRPVQVSSQVPGQVLSVG